MGREPERRKSDKLRSLGSQAFCLFEPDDVSAGLAAAAGAHGPWQLAGGSVCIEPQS